MKMKKQLDIKKLLCFFQTLRQEMDGYYDAEMTMKLAEVSIYDLEDDYGETDEV